MIPTYEKIAIFLFIIIIFTGVIFAIYIGVQIRKRKGKMNKREIRDKIQSIEGTIVTIQKVRSNQTPFNKPLRAKAFGDHYQITYELVGVQHTAWFRADRAIVQMPKPPDPDKWILTK
ncbi:hypothetical protein [Paenibacillus gorillae]|uniref:hypothetical protein n=1 Tax=Paenibacillus gorillae TaxID=1243662 RepID=UPI0005AA2E74|nr:hypothetical protein [Paenibacillus gorillae]